MRRDLPSPGTVPPPRRCPCPRQYDLWLCRDRPTLDPTRCDLGQQLATGGGDTSPRPDGDR